MAVPRPAHAYADPGSGAMLWQVAAAGMIGALFYVRRFMNWLREHSPFRSERVLGFVFATGYALLASPLVVAIFGAQSLPRFTDIFLVGIVLTAYLFSWEPAVYLLVVSLGFSAWILPPAQSFKVASGADVYRLASFTAVSVLIIVLFRQRKRQSAAAPREAAAQEEAVPERTLA